MSTTVAELVARLRADTSDFQRGMSAADRQIATSSRNLEGMGRSAQRMGRALTLGVTLPFTAAAAAGFRELQDSAKQAAITEAHIKSTGSAANVTAKHIDKMSEAMMRKSGIDDEVIKTGQNMLLTFTKVRNEVGKGNDIFDRASQAALDLSFQFGSVDGAAKMLGKALQDPVKGMSAMSRAGVTFSKEQQDVIRWLVATGDTLGAQKLILQEVERQVGGTADAYGKTLGGQLGIAKESLKNAAADMVEVVVPAIARLARVLNSVADFLSGMPGWAKTGFAGLATGAAILGPLLMVTGGIAKNLAAIKSLGGAAGAAGAAGGVGGVSTKGPKAPKTPAVPMVGTGLVIVAGGMAALDAMGQFDAIGKNVDITYKELGKKTVPQLSKEFRNLANESNTTLERFRELGPQGTGVQGMMTVLEGRSLALANRTRHLASENVFLAAKFVEAARAAGVPNEVLKQSEMALQAQILRTQQATIQTGLYTGALTRFGSVIVDAKGKVVAYATSFGLIPAKKNTTVKAETAQAQRDIDAWIAALERSRSVRIPVIATGGVGAMQFGGPVQKGRPYVVGEKRPELFVPNTSGRIIPSVPRGGGGGVTIVNIRIDGSVLSERKLISVVHDGLLRLKRQSAGLNL